MKGKRILVLVLSMAFCIGLLSMQAYAAPQKTKEAFDPVYYAQTNPDVVAALGDKADALYKHYVKYGKAEGRGATEIFDAAYYALTNPDVAAVFGNKADALYQHYVKYGKAEGRKPSESFNAPYYALMNPDVVAAVGKSPNALYQHYIQFGKAEGRSSGSGSTVSTPILAPQVPVSTSNRATGDQIKAWLAKSGWTKISNTYYEMRGKAAHTRMSEINLGAPSGIEAGDPDGEVDNGFDPSNPYDDFTCSIYVTVNADGSYYIYYRYPDFNTGIVTGSYWQNIK